MQRELLYFCSECRMRKERWYSASAVAASAVVRPTFVDVTTMVTVVTSRAARRPPPAARRPPPAARRPPCSHDQLWPAVTSGSGRRRWWWCGQSAALLRFGFVSGLLLGIWVSLYYVRIHVCVNAYMCILLTVCRSLQTVNAKRPSAYYANTNCYNYCFVSRIRLAFENGLRREL